MEQAARRRAITGLAVGDRFTARRTFARQESEAFGDLTRDYNPVHYDARFAGAKGYPRLICHGLLVGGLLCEVGGQLAWLATGMSFSFLRPVFFGDTVTCTVEIMSIDDRGRAEAQATYVNQDGIEVARSSMTGRLPASAAEKAALEAMLAESDQTGEPPRG